MRTGRYIVVEGSDGSGTTTISRKLVEYLQSIGKPTTWTHEPSDLPIGLLIRQVLTGRQAQMPEGSMPFLFVADRMHLLTNDIGPALDAGTWVVSDRSYWSTLAYQGLSFPISWLTDLHKYIPVLADLLILLDCPISVAKARWMKRGDPERYEKEAIQVKVRENFMRMLDNTHPAQQFIRRSVRVSSDKPVEETFDTCKTLVDELLLLDVQDGLLGTG